MFRLVFEPSSALIIKNQFISKNRSSQTQPLSDPQFERSDLLVSIKKIDIF